MANFLYNGVELPDINTVWTDKETYPYVYIAYRSSMALYGLTLSNVSISIDSGSSNYVADTNGNIAIYALQNGEWKLNSTSPITAGQVVGTVAGSPMIWCNHNILNEDGSVYLAASTPIRVDSKLKISVGGGSANGDGFALYNGVKLPKLPEWDKEAYPYAFLSQGSGSDYGDANALVCSLYLPSSPGVFTDGGVNYTESFSLTEWFFTDSQVIVDLLISVGISDVVAGQWYSAGARDVEVQSPHTERLGEPLWSSYDISDASGNVQLAASDPIPLDGYTVIEWDGDKTGLEVAFTGSHYRVADYIKPVSAISVYYADATQPYAVNSDLMFDDEEGVWTCGEGVYVFGIDGTVPDGGNSGIYFFGIGDREYCTTLFAYKTDSGDDETGSGHYGMVEGAVYEIEGGTARVNGAGCEIADGRARTGGAWYELNFSGNQSGEGGENVDEGVLLKDGEPLVEWSKIAVNGSNNPNLDNSSLVWEDGHAKLIIGSYSQLVQQPTGGTQEVQVPILPIMITAPMDLSEWTTLHFIYNGYATYGYGTTTDISSAPISWAQSGTADSGGAYSEQSITLNGATSGCIAIGNTLGSAHSADLLVTDIWLSKD